MHYYQFNIGDYASHTSHLDPIEDIAYRRMLDWLYTHETPLPLDSQEIARFIRMREHTAAIRDVLNEFFEKTDDGWVSSRVQREIDHYRTKVEQASKAGKASAERRLNGRSTGRSTDVQPTNNQEPITNNHKPKKEASPQVAIAPVVVPDWIPLETWNAFLAMRKKIKKPPTDYAIRLIIDKLTKFKSKGQDIKAVLEKSITSGWQDVFEIYDKPANKFDVANVTTPTPPNQDAALRKIEEDRKKAVPIPANIKAKMAELKKGVKA